MRKVHIEFRNVKKEPLQIKNLIPGNFYVDRDDNLIFMSEDDAVLIKNGEIIEYEESELLEEVTVELLVYRRIK